MIQVKFNVPKDQHNNPIINFDPRIQDHYPKGKAGIYIYGLKLRFEKKVEKFVPLYVGVSSDLNDRLYNDHFTKNHLKGNGTKDLWDFSENEYSLNDIYKRYAEMHHYDFINNYRNRKSAVGVYRESENYMNELLKLEYLLFFQNRNYFNVKNGLPFIHYKTETERELNHQDAINNASYIVQKSNIINTQLCYNSKFYFVYATMDDVVQIGKKDEEIHDLNKLYPDYEKIDSFGTVVKKKHGFKVKVAERIELATKKALNTIGIHTTAEAKGEIFDMNIDLSEIQNELVNMGGHPYNENGTYKDSLIIKIRK
jgi:hypothetical protein